MHREAHKEANSITHLVKKHCASVGRMATSKRVLVAQELFRMKGDVDAVTLYISLRQRHPVSISCVYMSLNVLAEVGLALAKPAPDGRYMLYRANGEFFSES